MRNTRNTPKPLDGTPTPRERASRRPAAFTGGWLQWELVPEGIKPRLPVAVDCRGSAPEFDNDCHNKPVWVIEDAEGYYPTCLSHSGKVLNEILVAKYSHDSEVSLYFHAYKGE